MYEDSVEYASQGIANTVHKFVWELSGPNQGSKQLA